MDLAERAERLCEMYFDRGVDPTYYPQRILPLLRDAGFRPYEIPSGGEREDPFYVRCSAPGRICVASSRALFRNELLPAAQVERRAELSCLMFSTPDQVDEFVNDYHRLEELRRAEEGLQETDRTPFTDYPIIREVVSFGEENLPPRMVSFLVNSRGIKKIVNAGVIGFTGYVVGAAGGLTIGAIASDGSVAVTGLVGLVGNRIGLGTALGIHGYRIRRFRLQREEILAEYQEALTAFQEKYAPSTKFDREGLMLALGLD